MTTSPFKIYKKNCDEAVIWAVQELEATGFQIIKTFDLQVDRHFHLDCSCLYHGAVQCDCQMVVLLVYQVDNPPATLLIRGSDEISSFFLVNTPQQSIVPAMERNIQDVLNRASQLDIQ